MLYLINTSLVSRCSSSCCVCCVLTTVGFKLGYLQVVLDYVGPGHWYFVSTVSKLFKSVYESVRAKKVENVSRLGFGWLDWDWCFCEPQMTLFSSIWSSPSRVELAHSTGVGFLAGACSEHLAGCHADQSTLVVAHELALQYGPDILIGAARSGDLAKAKWLYTEQHCELDDYKKRLVCCAAVKSGSIPMLD
jgi:hypothetical protein